jgi:ketosteroid isomerase-like protein
MSTTASSLRALFMALGIAFAMHPASVRAQSNTGDESQKIRAATEHFLRVFGNLDWDAFRAAWASEPTVFFPFDDTAERVTGRAAVEERWQRFFSRLQRPFQVNPRDLLIQRYGDAAIVTFNLGSGPGPVGRRTLVFVKENGDWKLAHLHASPLARAP